MLRFSRLIQSSFIANVYVKNTENITRYRSLSEFQSWEECNRLFLDLTTS